MLLEWNMTVAGCVLCIIFCWFLGILKRWEGVQFGKIGFIVGCVGVLVLTGLAISNPLHNLEHEGSVIVNGKKIEAEVETNPLIIQAGLDNLKRKSLAVRTSSEVGRRPSKAHTAWEFPDGRLTWVTKSEYRKLKEEEKEGEE